LKAELVQHFPNAPIELIEGSGGIFEVAKDGQLIFSKKQMGRFPDLDEILRLLK
jgi:selenoprotein W-related protein